MEAKSRAATEVDFEKYRLRNFVDRLIELDEVEIHDEKVPLTGLSPIIEATPKAVLFKQAGPERLEIAIAQIHRLAPLDRSLGHPNRVFEKSVCRQRHGDRVEHELEAKLIEVTGTTGPTAPKETTEKTGGGGKKK